MSYIIEITSIGTPQISLIPNVTSVLVEPGRQFIIDCESGGDFRGEVEWSRLIDSGVYTIVDRIVERPIL